MLPHNPQLNDIIQTSKSTILLHQNWEEGFFLTELPCNFTEHQYKRRNVFVFEESLEYFWQYVDTNYNL